MDNNIVFLGTEMKLNIHIDPIETNTTPITMDNYDFTVEVYCNPKKVIKATKEGNNLDKIVKVDSSNYIVLIDTNEIETGTIKCKVTAYIPDSDFEDKYRTEVVIEDTGIKVVKTL